MSKEKGFFSSRNPLMKESALKAPRSMDLDDLNYIPMTVSGAINKTFILFAIMSLTTAVSFMMPTKFLFWVGIIGGLGFVFAASFKPKYSAMLAPGYAVFEGFFVGSISAMYYYTFQGIVLQAVVLTFSTLFLMLLIYKTGIIKVTEKFRAGVVMATGAVFIFYVLAMVFRMFGVYLPYLHEGGMIGIGISVVIIGIASLNLLLDFDSFEKGAENKAPQYMEWFCAMGLLVTLVWLYVEFLRLLSIFARE